MPAPGLCVVVSFPNFLAKQSPIFRSSFCEKEIEPNWDVSLCLVFLSLASSIRATTSKNPKINPQFKIYKIQKNSIKQNYVIIISKHNRNNM